MSEGTVSSQKCGNKLQGKFRFGFYQWCCFFLCIIVIVFICCYQFIKIYTNVYNKNSRLYQKKEKTRTSIQGSMTKLHIAFLFIPLFSHQMIIIQINFQENTFIPAASVQGVLLFRAILNKPNFDLARQDFTHDLREEVFTISDRF